MAKQGYVGIEGKARKITDIYVGVDGKARKVKRAYVGVDGKAHMWFSDVKPGTYWIILSDGKTRCYSPDGTLLSEEDTNGAFVAPMSGSFTIEMHGGGGGGAGGVSCGSGWYGAVQYYGAAVSGSAGGGSGEKYSLQLVSRQSYIVQIGLAGKAGTKYFSSSYSTGISSGSGQDGGDTVFGDKTVNGGKGAIGSRIPSAGDYIPGAVGEASGSLAESGTSGRGDGAGYSGTGEYYPADCKGGVGGHGGGELGDKYGVGGNGGNAYGGSNAATQDGTAGTDGAIKIVFNG